MNLAPTAKRNLVKIFASFLLLILIFQNCRRSDFLKPGLQKKPRDLTVQEAMHYYDELQASKKNNSNNSNATKGNTAGETNNPEASPMWEAFNYRQITSGFQAVLVPLHKKGTYIGVSPDRMVKYGFLNYLLMYRDSLNNIVTEKVLLKPSLKWLDAKTARKYDGDIIVRDNNNRVKNVFHFEDGNKVEQAKAGKPLQRNESSAANLDDPCMVVTTYTFTSVVIPPHPCGCDPQHAYGVPGCVCPDKATNTTTYTTQLVTTTDIVCYPEDPPDSPPGNGGANGGIPGNGNGGGTGANDYPPLSCNPDPDYTVPTSPLPPGTEYVLPCSEVPIPTEPVEEPGNMIEWKDLLPEAALTVASAAINQLADSVYNNLSIPNNWEYMFPFFGANNVVSTGIVRTDQQEDYVTPKNLVKPGWQTIGIWHGHQGNGAQTDRMPHSHADIDYLRRHATSKNFISFVDCGNKRFALVITDPAKAQQFFNNNDYEKIVKNYTLPPGASNGNYQHLMTLCVKNVIGSISDSGIGFYSAESPSFSNFTLLN